MKDKWVTLLGNSEDPLQKSFVTAIGKGFEFRYSIINSSKAGAWISSDSMVSFFVIGRRFGRLVDLGHGHG